MVRSSNIAVAAALLLSGCSTATAVDDRDTRRGSTRRANFQHALSRASHVTRSTDGGINRLAFGPVSTALTQFGVQPRITALDRWHYRLPVPQSVQRSCIDDFAGNCVCE